LNGVVRADAIEIHGEMPEDLGRELTSDGVQNLAGIVGRDAGRLPLCRGRNRRPNSLRLPAGVLLVVMALFCAPLSAMAGSVEVIVNPDHTNAPIDRNLLRAIFTMRLRQWPDGKPIQVFVMPDGSDLSNQFCREQLGTYPYVMRATWDRIVFTGTGLAPTVVNSEREMRERVRSTPGAVGYIGSGTRSELLPTSPNVLFASLSGY
jgi:hypothetical protein